jgi:hypothetical protein
LVASWGQTVLVWPSQPHFFGYWCSLPSVELAKALFACGEALWWARTRVWLGHKPQYQRSGYETDFAGQLEPRQDFL